MSYESRERYYVVRGWLRDGAGRIPLSAERWISASCGLQAAERYASEADLSDADWNDGTPSPLVVIRVEEAPR